MFVTKRHDTIYLKSFHLSRGKFGGNPDVLPYLQGPANPPAPYEAGWKDAVIAYPGEVTPIAVRWAPTSLATNLDPTQLVYPFAPAANGQGYVWHCHVIDHEDNEMMRPDKIVPKSVLRSLIFGIHY